MHQVIVCRSDEEIRLDHAIELEREIKEVNRMFTRTEAEHDEFKERTKGWVDVALVGGNAHGMLRFVITEYIRRLPYHSDMRRAKWERARYGY